MGVGFGQGECSFNPDDWRVHGTWILLNLGGVESNQKASVLVASCGRCSPAAESESQQWEVHGRRGMRGHSRLHCYQPSAPSWGCSALSTRAPCATRDSPMRMARSRLPPSAARTRCAPSAGASGVRCRARMHFARCAALTNFSMPCSPRGLHPRQRHLFRPLLLPRPPRLLLQRLFRVGEEATVAAAPRASARLRLAKRYSARAAMGA